MNSNLFYLSADVILQDQTDEEKELTEKESEDEDGEKENEDEDG